MQKTCAVSGTPFEVSEEDLKFYEAISPVIGGKKYLIPAPALCPEERRRRRLAFRNERSFYRRKCDRCQKSLISVYSTDKPYTIYCRDCWWGDSWNGMDYAQDFDFSRPFFDQFAELQKKVPRLGIINVNDENSDYTNYGYQNKDCYLITTSDFNERCYFGAYLWNSFQCLDNFFVIKGQQCYECIDCDTVYECQYCQGCINCQNCFGCVESKNLKNCFGCVGLQNKEYHFFNQPFPKEEYEKKIQEEMKDIPAALQKIHEFAKAFPRRAVFQINCENVTGDHLKNCKNAYSCFDGMTIEDSKWVTNVPKDLHHCYDVDGAGLVEWCGEIIASGVSTNQCFALEHCLNGANEVYYSSYCMVNKNLFGCSGLRNKQYCVLNKQYTKEEYEALVPKIIDQMKKDGEWGEFFPIQDSLFSYNETVAQQVFPLSKEEVTARGWKWKDEEQEALKVERIIPGEKLPRDISKIPDDILSWAIECEVTKKPFRIIPQELAFYRQFHLPIPTIHPDERHRRRLCVRNPQKLWERTCDNCQKAVLSSYAQERDVKVWCEECYLSKTY